jgi:DNA-binding MarR family transcriptional regulator
MDKYENHKKVYDITDNAALVLSEFNKISKLIDPDYNIPNSLQAILGKVYRYEGKTQSEIAKIYKSDYQNTIRYISELETRGFIRKEAIDNKRKVIYLTALGQEVNNHFMEERGEFIEQVLSQVDEVDLRTTKETLNRIANIMSNYSESLTKTD